MTVHAALQGNAKAFPDRTWFRYEGAAWSYSEGDAITDRIAAGLIAHGIKAGDRVALLFTNCPEIIFCYYACFKIGAVAVPVNTRFQTPEVIYAVHHSGAVLLIGQPDLCAPLATMRAELPHLAEIIVAGTESFDTLLRAAPVPLPAVADSQLAVLMYTSGTTSRPKGVMHTHATLTRQCQNYRAVLDPAVYAQVLVSLPLCHMAAFSIWLLCTTEAGGTLTILPRFEPGAVLSAIAEHRITYAGAMPVMMNALVNHPGATSYDLSSLLTFGGGGDSVPLELQNRFEALFGVPVDELCGMTEIMYCNQPYNLGLRRPGSVGKPFGDVRLRLVDADGNDVAPGTVGEIIAYSGAVTLGYWNDPENTQAALQDGGMRTGDLARRDEDGFYWFAGRAKDIIIRGGSNISPGEVEDVLYTHPAVYEAGVVGVPCRELGQRVRAYVALKPGAQATDRDLMDWAATKIAAYKTPESIIFLDSLPKGATGKVHRKTLRDRAAEEQNL